MGQGKWAMPWVMMNDQEVGIWEGGVFDDLDADGLHRFEQHSRGTHIRNCSGFGKHMRIGNDEFIRRERWPLLFHQARQWVVLVKWTD